MRSFVLSAALLLAGSPAMAADVIPPPAKAPAVVQVSPAYNWTGFYVGLHGGYAAGDVVVRDTNGGVNPGPFGYTTNGGFGGGQIGFNWQTANLVLGIEGDIAYLANNGKGIIGSANAAAHQDLTLGNGALADITGRVGYAIGPVLLYAKGGGAWFSGSAGQKTTNPGYETTGTGAFTGWAAGAGAEYKLLQNVSIKAEYLHYDFGSRDGYQTNVGDKSSPIGYKFMNSTTLKFDTVKVGLNYQF